MGIKIKMTPNHGKCVWNGVFSSQEIACVLRQYLLNVCGMGGGGKSEIKAPKLSAFLNYHFRAWYWYFILWLRRPPSGEKMCMA